MLLLHYCNIAVVLIIGCVEMFFSIFMCSQWNSKSFCVFFFKEYVISLSHYSENRINVHTDDTEYGFNQVNNAVPGQFNTDSLRCNKNSRRMISTMSESRSNVDQMITELMLSQVIRSSPSKNTVLFGENSYCKKDAVVPDFDQQGECGDGRSISLCKYGSKAADRMCSIE